MKLLRRPLRAMCLSAMTLSLGLSAQTTTPESVGKIRAETLRPALDREGILDVESGDVRKHLDFDAGLWAWYANDPLNVARLNENDLDDRVHRLVSDRVGGSLTAQLSLIDWLSIGLEVPFVLYQTGETNVAPLAPNINVDAFSRGGWMALGDVRLLPKVRLLRQAKHKVNLAFMAHVSLPTSSPSTEYIGTKGFWIEPAFALSKRNPNGFRWAFNLGALFRQPYRAANLDIGDSIDARLGLGYNFLKRDQLGIDFAIRARAEFLPDFFSPATRLENAMEANAGVHYWIKDRVQLWLGGGGGLISGPGVPDFRFLAGVRYSSPVGCFDEDEDSVCDGEDECLGVPGLVEYAGCPDTDGDTVIDKEDVCVNEPGSVERRGCPDEDAKVQEPTDEDGDGIFTPTDKCPEIPGVEPDGCPAGDTDGDGIMDHVDKCPEIPGAAVLEGCADSDGDGISDLLDECPNKPETINGNMDEDGCPDEGTTKARLVGEKIDIAEKVYFRSGSATIKTQSYDLLNQVAAIMKNHPELTVMRIEGHTDSRDTHEYNLRLSIKRAAAVKRYLQRQGVDASRMKYAGFGETKPIADNFDWKGRAQNRRVEFYIEERVD